MLQFFKDSIRELQHVVWPTRKETQKYFALVLLILAVFGTYLFIFSNIFSEVIFALKSATKTSISYDTPTGDISDITDLLMSDEATTEQSISITEEAPVEENTEDVILDTETPIEESPIEEVQVEETAQ